MLTKETRKALVLDIDGTLTNTKKEITPATKAIVQQAMQAGHRVVIASGRPTPGIRMIEETLELQKYGGYILSFNGANCIDCTTRETIFSQTLPADVPGILYEFAREKGAGLISYDGDEVISAFEPDEFVWKEVNLNHMRVKQVEDFVSYINYPVNKCLLTAPGERAAVLEEELKALLGDRLSIYRSEPYFLEAMPLGVDKGNSLDQILDKIGVIHENTICCGDGFNDVSMIKYAQVGVAMANAQQVVKDAADYVTLRTNDEDGLVEVVEKFVLGKG